jgi:Putative metal-binding motif
MELYRKVALLAVLLLACAISAGCTSSGKSGSSSYPTASTEPVEDDDDDTTIADADGDGYDETEDCDDTDASINPDATEIPYDGIDQNCDGIDLTDVDGDGFDAEEADGTDCDDSDASIRQLLDGYIDADLDGFGTGEMVQVCTGDALPAGYAEAATDCNDTAHDENPSATETAYDGIDQDCDGFDICDVDGDGYYSAVVTDSALCPVAELPGDCNDADSAIHPAMDEVPYDGIDQDCDDFDLCDADGDGFFPEDDVVDDYLCSDTLFPGDCNDANNEIYPAMAEVPYDGIDQNCDDFDLCDADGDGYYSSVLTDNSLCPAADLPGDCDDSKATVHPAAEEICGNGTDDNCDDVQCSEPPIAFCPDLEVYPGNGEDVVAINEIVSAICIGDYFPTDTVITVFDNDGVEVPGRQQFYNCDSDNDQTCGAWQFQPAQMWAASAQYSVSIAYGGEQVGTWFATAAADSSAADYAPLPDNRFTSMPVAFLIEHTKVNKPEGMRLAIETGSTEIPNLLDNFNAATSWMLSPAGFPGMNAAYTTSTAMLTSGQAFELESSNGDLPELDHSSIGRLFLGDLYFDESAGQSKIKSINDDSDEVITMEVFYGLPVEAQGYSTEAAFGDLVDEDPGIDLVNGRSTATILNCQDTCDDMTAIYSAEYEGIERLCEPEITEGPFTLPNPFYICDQPADTMEYDMEWVGHSNPVSAVIIVAPTFVSAPVDGVFLDFEGARWDAANPSNFLAEETITLIVHSPDNTIEPLRSTDYVDSIDFLSYDCPSGEVYCELNQIFFNLPANFRTTFDIPAGTYCDVEVIVGLQYAFFKKIKF